MKRVIKLFYMLVWKRLLKIKHCKFETKTEFNLSSQFDGYNLIGYGTYFSNSRLGYASYLGNSCYLRGVYIGKYTCIGPEVRVAIGRHPVKDFVSIHPAFFSESSPLGLSYVDDELYDQIKYPEKSCINGKIYTIVIGNDVWIGAGVTIADGVTIGDGAVIGAGSYISNDVAPYEIVAGTPAKVIKRRFNDEEIRYLLKLQWWNKPDEWIRKYAKFFTDIKQLQKELDVKEYEA